MTNYINRQEGQSTIIWVVIVAVIATLALVAMPTILNNNTNQSAQNDLTPSPVVAGEEFSVPINTEIPTLTDPAEEATFEDIYDNLEDYEGVNVVFVGEINEIVSPNIIKIDEPGIIGKDLWVLSKQALPSTIDQSQNSFNEDDRVRVNGTVQQVSRDQMEGLGSETVIEKLFNTENEKYVILADDIRINDDKEMEQDQ